MQPISVFEEVPPDRRRLVLMALCDRALAVWEQHFTAGGQRSYRESVLGTRQVIDTSLPREAIETMRAGSESESVAKRYLEPIVALQDLDLVLPDPVEFAYYAIYNAFRLYGQSKLIEERLILTQALSALPVEDIDFAYTQALSAAV